MPIRKDDFDALSDSETVIEYPSEVAIEEIKLVDRQQLKPAPNPVAQSIFESWKAKTVECFGCQTFVPHNQLFVCTKSTCDHKPKHAVRSPLDFFTNEHVFCGSCSFRGRHQRHARHMEPAEPIAMKAAHDSVIGELKKDFKRICPKIPVSAFLSVASDAFDWDRKFTMLEKTRNDHLKREEEGRESVKQAAKEIMESFTDLQQTVKAQLAEIEKRKPKEKEIPVVLPKMPENDSKLICNKLIMHFESVREEMIMQEALRSTTRLLMDLAESEDQQKEVAVIFHEHTTFTLFV